MEKEEKKIRRRYIFSGSVQGVGFRYRTANAANVVGITGWVRNEYDGTVMAEFQGTPSQFNEVIKMVEKGSFVQIEHIDVTDIPIEENEMGFTIRH